MAKLSFQVVQPPEEQAPAAASPQQTQDKQQALQILMLSLATVGKRFTIALSNLFTAAALGSAWWLWSQVLPNPSVNQIVAASLYSVFVGAVDWLRRR